MSSTNDTNSCNICTVALSDKHVKITAYDTLTNMAFEFLKAIKLNNQINAALPVAEVCNLDILETLDLLEDFDKDQILYMWERFSDLTYISEFFTAVEDFGESVVDSFIDLWSVDDIEHIEDAFNGHYESEEQFAEELVTDCYCHSEQPYWVVTDWKATWESALRFDYDFSDGIIWRTAW